MTKAILWTLIVLIVGSSVAVYSTQKTPSVHWYDRLKHPMDTRVRYRIGVVDPRFGLSDEQMKTITTEAVEVWHKGIGKPLFVYDDNARLAINLVYDERQAQTQERQLFQAWLDDELSKHEDQEQRLIKDRDELHRKQQQIEQDIQNKGDRRLLKQQID